MLEKYITLHESGIAEIIEKKSRFIAHCAPINSQNEALNFVNEIRKKHADATHNVFAYRVFENMQIERQSDDGEPSGTSGMPVLDVLRKEEIQNAVIVVTRYYGGVLLGTGGLVRAYGGCAKKGVEVAGIVKTILYQTISVEVDYNLSGKVQYETLKDNYIIEDIVYGESVKYAILVEDAFTQKFIKSMTNLCNGNCIINLHEKIYQKSRD